MQLPRRDELCAAGCRFALRPGVAVGDDYELCG